MSTTLGILVLLALVTLLALRLGWMWMKYRGARLVTCPENMRPAGVSLATGHAAWTALAHAPALRLQTCSRWPERQDCGRACLRQIEEAPDGCLVRNVLTHWYEGKTCAVCGEPIGEIHWADRKPALLTPELRTVEWSQVRTETVPEALETHSPVCWNCHIVQTFRREHPDLVVDRRRAASQR